MRSITFVFFGLVLASQLFSQLHDLPVLNDNGIRRYRLPENISEQSMQPGVVMIRLTESSRINATDHSTGIPAVEAIIQRAGAISVSHAFPGHEKPRETKNEIGKPLTDISLIYKIRFPESADVIEIVNQLLSSPEVMYAEPAFIYETFFDPNDPDYPSQDYLVRIKAAAAWEITKGDSNVVIGIIDTGTSFIHPELADKVKVNYLEFADGIDNDNDGYTDNYHGWDFSGGGAGEDNDPTYVGNATGRDHGVVVTGPAAAKINNDYGIAGIGYNTTFLPLKAAPDNSLSIWNGYDAIVYAADHGVQICNLSWGAPGYSYVGHDVSKYATNNKGILLVAAAGNTPSYIKFYPATYEEVIGVAGTFGTSDLAWITTANFGTSWNHWVDICAPARFVTTTAKHNLIWWGATGTSLSAPQVCGAAALVKAHFPGLSMAQVGQRVRVTADDIYDINPDKRDMLGVGRLNCYNALTKITPAIRLDSLIATDGKNNLNEIFDTVAVKVDLINYLDPNENLNVTLSSTDPAFIQVLESAIHMPKIGTMQRSNFYGQFKILVKQAPTFKNVLMKLSYVDKKLGYRDFEYFYLPVHPTRINIAANNLKTTIDDAGSFGYFSPSAVNSLFGLNYKEQGNGIAHGGFLIGTDGNQFANTVYNENMQIDRDFIPIAPYSIATDANGDLKATVRYRNSNSATSGMNVSVTQNVYAWTASADQDYLIFEYEIANEGNQTLMKLNAGIFTWLFYNAFNSASAVYDPERRMIICKSINSASPANYFGLALLSDGVARGSSKEYNSFYPFTDAKKFIAMSNLADSSSITISNANLLNFLTANPFTLAPGGKNSIAFAIIGSNDLAGLLGARESAFTKYNCELLMRTTDADLGSDFVLCDGSSAALLAGSEFSAWTWSDGSTSNQITVNKAGNYWVDAMNKYGCLDRDSLLVTPGFLPNSGIEGMQEACNEISLDAGKSNAASYLWSTGETNSTISLQESGKYTLQMVSQQGCTVTENIDVKIRKMNPIIEASNLHPAAKADAEFLDATPGSTWRTWYFGDGIVVTNNSKTMIHQYQNAGNYLLKLIAGDAHCSDTTTLGIGVEGALGVIASNGYGKGIHAFPNPTTGIFDIEFTIDKPTNIHILLSDAAGKAVHQQLINQLPAGQQIVAVRPDFRLSPGIYFLEVMGENLDYREKMVIRN